MESHLLGLHQAGLHISDGPHFTGQPNLAQYKGVFGHRLVQKARGNRSQYAQIHCRLVDILAPITTKPWGVGIPQLAGEAAPTQEHRDSQLLFNEPKYVRMDDGDLHTLDSNGLHMEQGVYY